MVESESELFRPELPDYALLRVIGRGSYGTVWLARTSTGMYRALKVVGGGPGVDRQSLKREYEGVKRFERVSLAEPSQLALLHVGGDATDYFYYVMELADDRVRGREIDPDNYEPCTLQPALDRAPLPVREVIDLGVGMCGALATLHRHELVHRDVKPSNLVFIGGVPKLADIGLVSDAQEDRTVVGTPRYMPREGAATKCADTYALGKVLYELATGLTAYQWPAIPESVHQRPDRKLFFELNAVLLRACGDGRRGGFADASAMLEELQLLQTGKSILRLRFLEKRVGQTLRAVAILTLIAGVAIAGAWIQYKRAEKAEAAREEITRRRTFAGNMASAQRALEQNDYARGRALLDELVPREGQSDFRGLEWRLLRQQAEGDPHRVISTPERSIHALQVSADQRFVAVLGDENQASILATGDFRSVARLSGVRLLGSFSPDGRWIVGVDTESRLRRWSLTDGRSESLGPPSGWAAVGLATESIVVGMTNGSEVTLQQWNFVTGQQEFSRPISAHTPGEGWLVFRAAVDAGNLRAVAVLVRGSGSDARFKLVASDGRWQAAPAERMLNGLRATGVGFDQDGPWALIDSTGELWGASAQGWSLRRVHLPVGTKARCEWRGKDGVREIMASDQTLVWLDPATGEKRFGRGHGALVTALEPIQASGRILSAAADGGLFSWPLIGPEGRPTSLPACDLNAGAFRTVFTADSRLVWVPQAGDNIACFDRRTLKRMAVISWLRLPIALSGQGLLAASAAPMLAFVDPATGELKRRIPLLDSHARFAAVDRTGDHIAAVDHAGRLLAIEGGMLRVIGNGFERTFYMVMAPDGARLWTTDINRRLRCLAWPSGVELWSKTLPSVAPGFVFDAEANQLTLALENGDLAVLAGGDGGAVTRMYSGSAAPQSLVRSNSARRVIVGGIEGRLHFLDLTSGDLYHSHSLSRPMRIHAVEAAPDGSAVLVFGKTGEYELVQANEP